MQVLFCDCLACPAIAKARTVQVNQQNRTIEVAATASIQITADRVTITAGYLSGLEKTAPLGPTPLLPQKTEKTGNVRAIFALE